MGVIVAGLVVWTLHMVQAAARPVPRPGEHQNGEAGGGRAAELVLSCVGWALGALVEAVRQAG
ncbi:hypothetical protein [Streptomyces carpaticus]|uniref:Uncharacterized protein n=1 Tax=Streptomyces carpaticus TaxID=285558 RepID=A0ABV4ZND1_9ACTN